MTNHCYVAKKGYADWDEARAGCVALGSGWDLVVITSQEERGYVDDVVDLHENLWIGGFRNPSNQFEWVDGTPFAFAPWAQGEPNNDGDCLYFTDRVGPANNEFADTSCAEHRASVCEAPP